MTLLGLLFDEEVLLQTSKWLGDFVIKFSRPCYLHLLIGYFYITFGCQPSNVIIQLVSHSRLL